MVFELWPFKQILLYNLISVFTIKIAVCSKDIIYMFYYILNLMGFKHSIK